MMSAGREFKLHVQSYTAIKCLSQDPHLVLPDSKAMPFNHNIIPLLIYKLEGCFS